MQQANAFFFSAVAFCERDDIELDHNDILFVLVHRTTSFRFFFFLSATSCVLQLAEKTTCFFFFEMTENSSIDARRSRLETSPQKKSRHLYSYVNSFVFVYCCFWRKKRGIFFSDSIVCICLLHTRSSLFLFSTNLGSDRSCQQQQHHTADKKTTA